MRALQIFLFLFCFQIEVSLRAQSSVVSTNDRVEVLEAEGGRIFLLADGLAENTEDGWKILAGSAIARWEQGKSGTMSSLYGRVNSAGEIVVLCDEKRKRILVRAIKGVARVELRDGRSLDLPEGLQVEIGPVRSDGRNFHGLPSPIDIESHLRTLAELPETTTESMRIEVGDLRRRWQRAPAKASGIYEAVTERHLDEVRREQAEARRKQAVEREKRAEFRRLLHRKAFEE